MGTIAAEKMARQQYHTCPSRRRYQENVIASAQQYRRMEMKRIVSGIATCIAMAVALSAHAQTAYPSKPVRLLIPFPPGGPTDSAVRVFLPALSQALGQEFSIVNMAGSHGALAPTALLREPPDGHTLLVGNSSPLVAVPILRKDAPYDPVRDFAPVSLMGWTPLLLMVTPNVPANSLP